MRIVVVTLFPEFVEHALGFGVLGRALERGVLAVDTVNPRQFATDVHKTVDDRPYGGGPGMVLKAEPLRLAMAEAAAKVPLWVAADVERVVAVVLSVAWGIDLLRGRSAER